MRYGKSLTKISIKEGNRNVTKQNLSSSTLVLDSPKHNLIYATNEISSLNSRQRTKVFSHPTQRAREGFNLQATLWYIPKSI